jgi:RNA polymerase sigma-70 factor (ECF subfamily)
MTTEAQLAQIFDHQRHRLLALAYRVLGCWSDAEDVVQEAWLRLSRQDADEIENLPGWLTTVVSRICIDALRSRAARPEVSLDADLPELVVTDDVDTPEDTAVLADSIGLALLVVLGSLRPDERLAFVLHDMFAVPFAEIGPILDRSADAAKMLASRARRKVQDVPRPAGDRRARREVVDAFLAAAQGGDFDALLQVLDPDITWRQHSSHGVRVMTGSDEVVAAIRRGRGARIRAQRVLVNGEPGILGRGPSGRPLVLMACTVRDGRLVGVESIADPARLAELDLPDDPGDG